MGETNVRSLPQVPQLSRTPGAAAWMIAGAVLLTALATFGLTRVNFSFLKTAAPHPGKLTIVTRPAGADVTVDGERRGTTPLTLSIPPGAHTVSVRSGSDERVLPLTVAPDADIVRELEMTAAAPPVASGVLTVVTDPAGARVTIDGRPAGTSPLTLEGLAAAEHTVVVSSETGSAERTVTIAAGRSASVMFSLPKVSGPVGGWLTVTAPFDVQIIEKDEVIGAGGAARIMLAAGRHDVLLVNKTIDYQEAKRFDVVAGKTTSIRVDPPKVTLSVNARPWADVTIDGTNVGQTPIANASVALGTHQVVFRHPQFGEKRQTVIVTAKGPNRIAVDLTK
jgi:hypothetical protein